jgi:asparagine synthase (glutamine-hydrolysing)
MCGVAGIFEPAGERVVESAVLRQMTDAIRHRGPDAEGFHTGNGIGLGHRRLSIIDLEGGRQPMSNEDGTVWVAFNGEIYNFQELNRRYLQSHAFATRSDTETIVHLYEELGEQCFAALRGMFAIAVWDSRRRRLLLARDRTGEKPLFYSWTGSRFVFASEIKALLQAGGVKRNLDLTAVSDYFSYQYVPAPKTIYRDVRKLRPAHYLVVDKSGIREVPYWDIRFDQTRQLSETDWCEAFLDEYRTAVKSTLVSDVPLGAFLSGGIDSSSVVAVMGRFQSSVTTCSIGFQEDAYNEAGDARQFAGSVGTTHYEEIVRPNVGELIPRLAWHYDEPFGDSSAIPTWYVSRLARRHVTVALSGDGGDESFAGYRRYRLPRWEDRIRTHLPQRLRRAVFGVPGRLYPRLRWAPRPFRAKSVLESLGRSPLEAYFHSVSCCPPSLKHRLFSPDVQRSLRGYDSLQVLQYHHDRAAAPDFLSTLQYIDMKTYLVDDVLAKVDRASMANSLEVRCPLLDYKLMELVARMPSSLKLRNGEGKYIFKKALHGIVPSTVLNRPKRGFALPVSEWLRGDLKQPAFESLFGGGTDELLNRKFLTDCWNEHQSRRYDWSPLLWCVIMFTNWQKAYIQ